MAEYCHTCGHLVRVVSDIGETTMHYEPIEPEPLAVGWAMPERSYYVGPHTRGCDWKAKYDRQIRVYLDRVPKGSKPVTITRKPDDA